MQALAYSSMATRYVGLSSSTSGQLPANELRACTALSSPFRLARLAVRKSPCENLHMRNASLLTVHALPSQLNSVSHLPILAQQNVPDHATGAAERLLASGPSQVTQFLDAVAPHQLTQLLDTHGERTHQHVSTLLYQLSEAMAAVPAAEGAQVSTAKVDWLTPVADGLQTVLVTIQAGLEQVHVPYSYGWSIIALTALVKLVTLPLTKTQVESGLAVQKLKPTVDLIKRRYGEDKDRISKETAALYEKTGVNPLAGCLPTLATLPVFWGLYRTLSNVAEQGLLLDGFYFIPSLAGPTSIAARMSGGGGGIAWLWPLVDGVPPIGWDEASRYLALPILLVIAQFVSSAVISPPVDPKDDTAKNTQLIVKFLPFMIGWFALNLPSGLGLYYLSNTVLTTAQQIYLRKLGGANSQDFDLGPIGAGQGRRTGLPAAALPPLDLPCLAAVSSGAITAAMPAVSAPSAESPTVSSNGTGSNGATAESTEEHAAISGRSKRRRRSLMLSEEEVNLEDDKELANV